MVNIRKKLSLILSLILVFTVIPFKNSYAASNLIQDNSISVDYINGIIAITADKDVELSNEAKANISTYINLSTTSLTNPTVTEDVYQYKNDTIDNYDVSIDGVNKKKLVLKLKNGNKFSNFAKYTVKIKDDALTSNDNGTTIYNRSADNTGYQTFTFNTDNINILEDTYPKNNQEIDESNPLIYLKFKYPIDSNIDKTKIVLTSNGVITSIDIQNYLFVSTDGKLMRIDLDRLVSDKKFPLLKDTPYQLKFSAGAIGLKGYKDLQGNLYKYNKDIAIDFKTSSLEETKRWIYKIESTLGINNFTVTDFYNKEIDLNITGNNLGEELGKSIKEIRFVREGDSKTVYVLPYDIISKDKSKISIRIKGTIANEFSKGSSIGTYGVSVYYSDGTFVTSNLAKIKINPKGIPLVKRTEPGSFERIDETSVYSEVIDGKTVYFIKVVFYDLDETLNFVAGQESKILEYNVYSNGSSENLVDKTSQIKFTKNLSQKEGVLYIPLKSKLTTDTTYTVVVPAGVVENDGVDSSGNKLVNDKIQWSFYTNSYPTVSDISIGSVPEGYSKNDKIIIQGDMFNSSTRVYFKNSSKEYKNGVSAYKVEVKDSKTLHVYLPYDDRLEVGTYDIVVKNDSNHVKEVTYGVLSVVPKGKYVPGEGYRMKEEAKEGQIKESVKVSEDTIIIDSSKSYIDLDLDELMGEDTLVRKIKYEEGKDAASTIETKSKYADITIYGISPASYNDEEELIINLGRVEPEVRKTISSKLRGKNAVSDFIQISGDNFKCSKVELKVPFKDVSGDNIRVLRYDETLRNWYDVSYTVNKVDKVVQISSLKPGIFAVVE